MPRLAPFLRAAGAIALAAARGAAQVPAASAPDDAAPAARRARVAALDSLARAPVARGDVAGLAVVVRRGADTLLARGYGLADVARRAPAAADAVFPIASLTKQVAAAAVLRLAEAGRLGLDDEVARHLPSAAARAALGGRRVTVRQLLTHTAGLPDFAERPDPDSARAGPVRPEATLARVRGAPFDFAPGAELRYSNTGYLLLGLLVERLTGESFGAHVTRTLLAPAGARAAGPCAAGAGTAGAGRPARHVPGYRRTRAGLEPVRPLHPSVAHAAGGTYLCASALDLDAWNAALHGGRVLRPASYAAMTAGAVVRAAPGDTLRARYGFGVALSEVAGRRAVHHGGDVRGFAHYLAYLPDDSLSVALLMNTEGPVRQAELAGQLAAAALGAASAARAPARAAVAAAAGAPAPLARLAGRYGPAAFVATGDQLAFVWDGGPPEPLRPLGARTFTNGPGRFTFVERPGAPPAVWADLVFVVARWPRRGPAGAAPAPR